MPCPIRYLVVLFGLCYNVLSLDNAYLLYLAYADCLVTATIGLALVMGVASMRDAVFMLSNWIGNDRLCCVTGMLLVCLSVVRFKLIKQRGLFKE